MLTHINYLSSLKKTFNTGRKMEAKLEKKRFLTGFKPTGHIHLGNYFGAIQPAIELSKKREHEVILMIANWHGLADRKNIFSPAKHTKETLATFIALGFELKDNSIIIQSDFNEILEIQWYLSSVATVGLLERAHAYKDAIQNGKVPSIALFNYPILMAADILTFGSEYVPIGKDQSQHLEYASDLAKGFNNLTNTKTFLEPKAIIQETPILIGTDGTRKMSKSYKNEIPIFTEEKELEKRIKEIKTDSKGLNDPKDPETCTIYNIFKTFASKSAMEHMYESLKRGQNYGYGHAKLDFISEHKRVFSEKRKKFQYYFESDDISSLLKEGYERAEDHARRTLEKARKALKIPSLSSL